jgi:transcriptional regulator with XRE-family HTH domain
VNKQTFTRQISIKVGKRLSEVRVKRGLTQEKLAHEAGLNRAYVGYIERGERNPSIATIAKLAKALKIEVSELFKFKLGR